VSKFCLQRWGETAPAEWEFIGWRNDGQALLLLDPSGDRHVLPLLLPSVLGVAVGRLSPDATPRSILPMRLVPPPVRNSEREARALIDFARMHDLRGYNSASSIQAGFISFAFERDCDRTQVPEPWELDYGEALWPTPEDESPLRQRLLECQAAWRRERNTRLKAARRLKPEAGRAETLARLHDLYDAPLRRMGQSQLVGGCLSLTVESLMQQGHELLNAVLCERWARGHGLDLAAMEEQRRAFDNLMEAIRRSRGSLPYQEILALCRGSVRFVMDVGMRSGSLWLTECQPRPPRNQREVAEFNQLGSRRKPPLPAASSRPVRTSEVDVSTWPDLVGRKEVLQLLRCSKNDYLSRLTQLGVKPISPDSVRKQFRKADLLRALNGLGP
jgi:hypothetical protein